MLTFYGHRIVGQQGTGQGRDVSPMLCTGKELMARLQSEHPDRFTETQLRTMQGRVKEWRGIMAKKLVYATTGEAFSELSELPKLTLTGAEPRC